MAILIVLVNLLLAYVISVFAWRLRLVLLLWQGGHGIFDVRNCVSACCKHECQTGTEESALVLIQFSSVQFSPWTDRIVGRTWGTIQQRSSSSLFCGRPVCWFGKLKNGPSCFSSFSSSLCSLSCLCLVFVVLSVWSFSSSCSESLRHQCIFHVVHWGDGCYHVMFIVDNVGFLLLVFLCKNNQIVYLQAFSPLIFSPKNLIVWLVIFPSRWMVKCLDFIWYNQFDLV